MPVRSSSSSVLRWPSRDEVLRAIGEWAATQAGRRPELLALGYFGSLASGRWGVGSDADLVAVVSRSEASFHERTRTWPMEELPVPADLLVYTREEWRRLLSSGSRFGRMLAEEVVWVWGRPP